MALVVDSNGFAPFPEFLLKGGLHGQDLGLTSAPMTGSRGGLPRVARPCGLGAQRYGSGAISTPSGVGGLVPGGSTLQSLPDNLKALA